MESERTRHLGLFVVLGLFAWTAALPPPLDLDMFAHLRIGAWVLEHGRLIREDPFSQQGGPYISYAWPFSVGASLVFERFGWVGILVAKCAMFNVAAVLIARLLERREARPWPFLALLALALLGMLGSLNVRTWIASIIFLTLTLDRTLEARRTVSARPLYALPFVFAIWANLHIQFVYGLLVVFLLFLEAVHDRFRCRRDGLPPLTVLLVGAACALATLLTPFHLGLWRTVLILATKGGATDAILELQAPSFRGIRDWTNLAALALAAYAFGRRREDRAFPYLLLAALAYLTFHARRDSWTLAIGATALIPRPRATAPRLTPLPVLALIGALALLAGLLGRAGEVSEARYRALEAASFPEEAAAFIRGNRLPGPLWNAFNQGAFLIWRLPEHPVSIDGRTDVHDAARVARNLKTCNASPGWSSDPELVRARIVLVPSDFPLAEALRSHPAWRLLHEDAVACVFAPRGDVR
ncbi:MAG TPA: hypothetical protein VFF73_14035 [Planctomycetota bacterium]|nr:hypothetical protein [Planctomycetota bacterium]